MDYFCVPHRLSFGSEWPTNMAAVDIVTFYHSGTKQRIPSLAFAFIFLHLEEI